LEAETVPNVTLYNPAELAPPVGFAHAAEANGLVWLGGQISNDAEGNLLHPGDMAAQFARAIGNVERALGAAGCRPHNVVKLTYYVTDVTAYRAALKPIGAAYREVFGKHYPATTLVAVTGLFEPLALIEIEAVAIRPTEDDDHAQ
jgi:enamine deaminase RidA (YjgF/YER057c/UK114 family)